MISEPNGGTSLNPFKSGRSYLELRPFYRFQEIDGPDVDTTVKTNGLDFWLQFATFVEVGRVAPEWGFSRLHSDMKWDAGLGIRAWVQGIVIRIDTAYSDEGFGFQMMISQPFQF